MASLDVLKDERTNADILPTPGLNGETRQVRFGCFVLDYQRGCITRDGVDVTLRPKTFGLLCHFAENAGRLITKDELLDAVWPDVVVTDDSLVRCVAELRQALEDDDHKLIRTVPRRGYRFDPESRERRDGEPSRSRARRFLPFGLLGLLAVTAGAAWLAVHEPAPVPPFSIVVLPFDTHGVADDRSYLGESVANDITADLARLPSLFVIAQASARSLADEGLDARDVARLLNVRYVLDGTIEQSGDTLRITAELISAETGIALWAERFQSPRDRLAESRDDIVGRIATTLNFRLTRLESERSNRERPDDPRASDFTARGWALVYSGKHPDKYRSARDHFRQALRHDPRAVDALAGIGWTSAVMVLDGWSSTPSDDTAIAADAVVRTLEIDPNHVVAHHVRGFLFRLQKRPQSARDAFRTVVALNPNFAPGHAQLAITELELGRPEAVLPAVEQAMRLSPRDPSLGPWLAFVGMAELHRGNPRDAIGWLERAIDTGTPVARHQAYLASALALDGRIPEAREILAVLIRERPSATIDGLRAGARSREAAFLSQQERLFDGLRLAGLRETATDITKGASNN